MAKTTKSKTPEEIQILEINQGVIDFNILGQTPLILNRMSEKAQRELLLPKKKSAAERAASLKHNPPEEFRASAYRSTGNDAPTRILMPSTAFKNALRHVALDMPGAAKTTIGRLTYVEGSYVDIYGAPKMLMSVVRSSDMNRTPDIRTRAIVPEWACRIRVRFVKPLLREKAVIDLLAAAGIMRGIGDYRPEKGLGDYGQFHLVGESDKKFNAVLKQGRKEQDEAFEHPVCFDAETAELLTWFTGEAEARGFGQVA